MLNSRFFLFCLGAVALLLIVYLLAKVSFILVPVIRMINILIVPFALAGFFYYLLRPAVRVLAHRGVPRAASVLLVYLALIAAFALFWVLLWPTLIMQVHTFVNSAPSLVEAAGEQFDRLQHNRLFALINNGNGSAWPERVSEYFNEAINAATEYVTDAIAFITNFVVVVATTPIILYYMLKGGGAIPRSILRSVPRRYRRDGKEVMAGIDAALSGFIVGRIIIAILLGIMLYIGFLIIGLPYSLLIAIIATILNIIPYIGPIVGAVPCVLVAFSVSPSMALWVLVVIVSAQQIEGNLLSPHVYGRRLDIHPLTTIVILLAAVEISGILGVILAIPAYMAVKIIIKRLYKLFLAEKVEEFVD